MIKATIPIITTTIKLTKKPMRMPFSINVPLTAARIRMIPIMADIFPHILFSKIRRAERIMKDQLNKIKIPAAVVIYS